jgi:hypothetical protein
MSDLRAELQRKATGAFLQYALLRVESALVVAGTILLTVFLPNPFPWWPIWAWPILGAIGWAAVVYASLSDPTTSGKVLSQLLREQLDLGEIQDLDLRERIGAMCDYLQSIETDLYGVRTLPDRPVLEQIVDQLVAWVEKSALFARYVDTYGRDYRLETRRQELPGLIETLVARLKYEKNPDIIDRLNAEMETLGRDLQSLQLLDAQMTQGEAQLGQTLTALARAASQVHVIVTERNLGQDHIDNLKQEVELHLGQATDLVNQVEQLYTDALNKG